MIRSLLPLSVFGLMLGASLCWGQANRPPAVQAATSATAGTNVALLDLGYILRNHPGYTAKRNALKERAQAMTSQEASLQKQLQAEGAKLREFQSGSLEHKQLESRLLKQASDFQLQAKIDRRELAEEEAKMLFDTYTEVQQVIDRLAKTYGIQLVIRFDRERMDPSDPDSISRGLMNPVVFHRERDITDLVLRELPQPTARPLPSNNGLR
jgi:Skp family chaperone for outer membrane proteins